MYFIEKYNLVLDHDTFRLELDYWSIILQVNYPYFRIYISSLVMALIPVRLRFCRFGWRREFDGGSEPSL